MNAPTHPLSPKAAKQRRSPIERARDNPHSLRLAADAMCYQCQDDGMNTPHIVKSRVRDCASKNCPLWHVRGFRGTTTRIRDETPGKLPKPNGP